jgi:serine/threonine protein kinase
VPPLTRAQARKHDTNQEVALKIIQLDEEEDSSEAKEFTEARALARCRHPNVTAFYGAWHSPANHELFVRCSRPLAAHIAADCD